MNKKSLLAIERVITCINELTILTKDKKAEYFFDSWTINALIDLIYEVEDNLDKVSIKIKEKYPDIKWDIINKSKEYDKIFGESTDMNLGKVWLLASESLRKEILYDLEEVLNNELLDYYTELCNNEHEKAIKEKALS
ncbi:MAG: hypothetical protein IJ574_05600 [Bacilli bacterium]|nr:hypothetical protein [Bacilli bacterium]